MNVIPELQNLANGSAAAGDQLAEKICLDAITELVRLQGIVDKLPLFADDVIAYPGMKGWFPGEGKPGIVNKTNLTCGNDDWGAGTEECYSTRKAATTAEAGGDDHVL